MSLYGYRGFSELPLAKAILVPIRNDINNTEIYNIVNKTFNFQSIIIFKEHTKNINNN